MLYAPAVPPGSAGGGAFFGIVVARSVKVTGGCEFHYDLALKGQMAAGSVKQISLEAIAVPANLSEF